MGSHYEAPIRKPLVTGYKSYHQISVDVARPIEGVANKKWWIVFGISLILGILLMMTLSRPKKIYFHFSNTRINYFFFEFLLILS